jgi:hypothetical protein
MRLIIFAAAGTVLILPPGFTAALVWLAWRFSAAREQCFIRRFD